LSPPPPHPSTPHAISLPRLNPSRCPWVKAWGRLGVTTRHLSDEGRTNGLGFPPRGRGSTRRTPHGHSGTLSLWGASGSWGILDWQRGYSPTSGERLDDPSRSSKSFQCVSAFIVMYRCFDRPQKVSFKRFGLGCDEQRQMIVMLFSKSTVHRVYIIFCHSRQRNLGLLAK